MKGIANTTIIALTLTNYFKRTPYIQHSMKTVLPRFTLKKSSFTKFFSTALYSTGRGSITTVSETKFQDFLEIAIFKQSAIYRKPTKVEIENKKYAIISERRTRSDIDCNDYFIKTAFVTCSASGSTSWEDNSGGGIHLEDDSYTPVMSMCSFYDCFSEKYCGAAVILTKGAEIENSCFYRNYAKQAGNAFYIKTTQPMNIQQNSILMNGNAGDYSAKHVTGMLRQTNGESSPNSTITMYHTTKLKNILQQLNLISSINMKIYHQRKMAICSMYM